MRVVEGVWVVWEGSVIVGCGEPGGGLGWVENVPGGAWRLM